jgi:hypothetical protein
MVYVVKVGLIAVGSGEEPAASVVSSEDVCSFDWGEEISSSPHALKSMVPRIRKHRTARVKVLYRGCLIFDFLP